MSIEPSQYWLVASYIKSWLPSLPSHLFDKNIFCYNRQKPKTFGGGTEKLSFGAEKTEPEKSVMCLRSQGTRNRSLKQKPELVSKAQLSPKKIRHFFGLIWPEPNFSNF